MKTIKISLSDFYGKNFVFTGILDNFTRNKAKNFVIKQGGHFSISVTNITDYLVVGKSPGSKLQDAIDRGIPIIAGEHFLDLYKESLVHKTSPLLPKKSLGYILFDSLKEYQVKFDINTQNKITFYKLMVVMEDENSEYLWNINNSHKEAELLYLKKLEFLERLEVVLKTDKRTANLTFVEPRTDSILNVTTVPTVEREEMRVTIVLKKVEKVESKL